MVPKTSPGDARVLILAWTDGLGRATADYVGLTALFPFSVRFSLAVIYRDRASSEIQLGIAPPTHRGARGARVTV